MLEEFTSREQQNSKQGLALFSLKIALEHLIRFDPSDADVVDEPELLNKPGPNQIKMKNPPRRHQPKQKVVQ